MCGTAVTIWSTCGLSASMCGMAVTSWSTSDGFERGFERKYNLINLWYVWYGFYCSQVIVTIWSTCN